MHLIVFDMDGTLIDPSHSAIDEGCFWKAVREILQVDGSGAVWIDGLTHVTGAGIAAAFCEQEHQRKITPREIWMIAERYAQNLMAQLGTATAEDYATSGARSLLNALASSSQFCWAVATGCFRATAEFKLKRASIFDRSMVLATSDDAISREEIMLTAAERARFTSREIERITYVGDGSWDLVASRAIGWDFIGIGKGERAVDLKRQGARHVLADFGSTSEFFAALD